MIKKPTVTPAYGRDYTSAAAARADWDADKDFVLRDISDRDDGRYCNRQDIPTGVVIRYNKLTMLCTAGGDTP